MTRVSVQIATQTCAGESATRRKFYPARSMFPVLLERRAVAVIRRLLSITSLYYILAETAFDVSRGKKAAHERIAFRERPGPVSNQAWKDMRKSILSLGIVQLTTEKARKEARRRVAEPWEHRNV